MTEYCKFFSNGSRMKKQVVNTIFIIYGLLLSITFLILLSYAIEMMKVTGAAGAQAETSLVLLFPFQFVSFIIFAWKGLKRLMDEKTPDLEKGSIWMGRLKLFNLWVPFLGMGIILFFLYCNAYYSASGNGFNRSL